MHAQNSNDTGHSQKQVEDVLVLLRGEGKMWQSRPDRCGFKEVGWDVFISKKALSQTMKCDYCCPKLYQIHPTAIDIRRSLETQLSRN